MDRPSPIFDKQAVRKAFNRSASRYDQAAVLQREVVERMLDRLQYIKFKPEMILDVGSGTGFISAGLKKHYPRAQVVELDLAINMLQQAHAKQPWYKRLLRKPLAICADAEQLPVKDNSIDLLISSLTIQWCNDLEQAFAEFHRVLKPGGLLMFTSFGPDTLTELRQSWAAADQHAHVSPFADMHDMGDLLLRARLAEPVMDVERFTLTYQDVDRLVSDLRDLGATNALRQRQRGLSSRAAWQAMQTSYESLRNPEGLLPASYEVVYGHAWKAEQGGSVEVEFTATHPTQKK